MSSISPLSDYERDAISPHFDEVYYLSAYPDVAEASCTLLEHYWHTGWREGRNPSSVFNTSYYLKAHPDVAEAGMNPLFHYALAGIHESRQAIRRLDAWRTSLEDLYNGPEPELFRDLKGPYIGKEELIQAFSGDHSKETLIFSVSHDDYVTYVGGVQNVIFDEEQASIKLGWTYVHIAPVFRIMALSEVTAAHKFEIGLRLNGRALGLTTMDCLLEAIHAVRPHLTRAEIIIHHLIPHAPELILELIKAVAPQKPIFWAHDYFLACPNHVLLRNNVAFCGGPPQSSSACEICHYGNKRARHVARIERLFEEVKPVLMSPSSAAINTLTRACSLAVSEIIEMPLAQLFLSESNQRHARGDADSPLRIAHLGARAFHKGWPTFENLALRHRGDKRYQFFQLGYNNNTPIPDCITHIPVKVTRSSRHRMVEAIAEHQIDIAIIWPYWPETFCFTNFEALAGGAFVITNKDSGNVAALLKNYSNDGMVLSEANDLEKCFAENDLIDLVSRAKRRRGVITYSSNTIGWLKDGKSISNDLPISAQESL